MALLKQLSAYVLNYILKLFKLLKQKVKVKQAILFNPSALDLTRIHHLSYLFIPIKILSLSLHL